VIVLCDHLTNDIQIVLYISKEMIVGHTKILSFAEVEATKSLF